MSKDPHPSGFTLVEMLVVVTLIVLLIAMLLPALGTAKEKGRRSVCASQLHQVFMATVDYSLDNQRLVPPRPVAWSQYHVANYDPPSGTDGMALGFKFLVDSGSLGSHHSLFCPSDPRWRADSHWPDLTFGASWKPYLSSYAQREELIDVDRYRTTTVDPSWSYISDWFTTAIPANPHAVHNDGWNVGYFDGSGRWRPRTEVIWNSINWSLDFTAQAVTWYAFDQ